MTAPEFEWYMPGSVLSALWGTFMPRLAAYVWQSEIGQVKDGLKWPPKGVTRQLVCGKTYAYPITDGALKDFWKALVTIVFGAEAAVKGVPVDADDQSGVHRAARLVLDYFDPNGSGSGAGKKRIQLRVIQGDAYDFVLSSNGLDIYIPDDPFMDSNGKPDREGGREKVLQMYKFRETGKPPIGLPGDPSSFTNGNGGNEYLIPIPQLTAPTGAYQIQEDWVKGMASDVAWWISGSAYRGMMAALPRVIANLWYEEVAWPKDGGNRRTVTARFSERKGLKKLLEERMETVLPDKMDIEVVKPGQNPDPTTLPNWNPHDVMITDKGLYFPDPGKPPEAEALLEAIVKGQAGNPVFTDSGPCAH